MELSVANFPSNPSFAVLQQSNQRDMNKQEIRKVLANIRGKYNVANSAQVWGPVSTLAEFFERNPSDSNDCLGSHRNGLIESFDHNSCYITHLLNAWETRSKIAGSTDYAQLNEIEASFNSIWGELESENLRRITLPPDTTTTIGSALSSFIESPRMQETGLWLAIDCFHELNQSSTNVLCQSESSVETLLLLYGDKAIGCVGKLVMDRFQHGNVLYPHPFAVGLCYIGLETNDGFLAATHRAFAQSGIPASNRFRWRIQPSNLNSESSSPLHVPILKDRSCEAAYLCALWAANGGIPDGDPEEDQLVDGEGLDPYASVTATLGEGQGKDTMLGMISGLPEKALAAYHHGITLIVVAIDQMAQDKGDIDAIFEKNEIKDWEETLSIKEVATAGEAFHELIRSSRFTRIYHEAVIADFAGQFYEIDDEGNPIDAMSHLPLAPLLLRGEP